MDVLRMQFRARTIFAGLHGIKNRIHFEIGQAVHLDALHNLRTHANLIASDIEHNASRSDPILGTRYYLLKPLFKSAFRPYKVRTMHLTNIFNSCTAPICAIYSYGLYW